MSKNKPIFNENAAIRGAIRRVFSRSPIVREVLFEGRREVPKYNKDGTRSKRDAVQYQCQVCGQWVSSTKIAVDHIIPVISVETGFIDWNEFVKRLGFQNKKNLQRICEMCHNEKTRKERIARLNLQYQKRLVEIEDLIIKKQANNKEIKKELAKFILKKKIKGLEQIADLALILKEENPVRGYYGFTY